MFDSDMVKQPIILIVDDQPTIVIALEQAVRGLGTVLFATDGRHALKIAEEASPDLVLLDIELPDMDGYEICQKLRAMKNMSEASIIFITSHTAAEKEVAALEMGGVDFIHKPLNMPLVMARLKTHLKLQSKAKQLALSQKNLADIVFNLPVFLGQFDSALAGVLTNDLDGTWTKFPGVAFKDKPLSELFDADIAKEIVSRASEMQDGQKVSFDLVLDAISTAERQDNKKRYCEVSLLKQVESVSEQNNFLVLINDISARKLAEVALHEEKERIRVMLESIADAVIATDINGNVTFINAAAELMTGWTSSEAIGNEIEAVMPLAAGDSSHTLRNPIRVCLEEKRVVGMAIDTSLVRRSGERLNVEDSASPVRDHEGAIVGAIIVFHDVSHARKMAVQMTQLANFDVLTGLPNRELLRQKAEQAIKDVNPSKSHVALILLDIDNFKTINNSIGHSSGDLILQKIAIRLKSKLSAQQTLCRRGGDEFIFLLPNINDIDEIQEFISSVTSIVSEVYFIGDKRLNLTSSMGISLYPDDAQDLETLFRHADSAMYKAKNLGKSQYCFFSSDIEDSVRTKHELEMQMYEALEKQTYEVHYQPQYSISQGRFLGAEALIRLRAANGELIPPGKFIPVAEESGLIVQIGEFVLRQACLDCRQWQSALPGVRVSVNVSAHQFEQADFVGFVRQVLLDAELAPELLELEVTEGVLASDMSTMLNMLNELRVLGVSIAIDDFGTGYSSLTYLKYFPIDVLKIDQSFIRDMLHNTSNYGIVSAIIKMAESLELSLVAEGVETEVIANELSTLGCDVMQGYYYAKPLPVNGMVALLQAYKPT